MTEIISVRFKSGGKEYYFDPQGVRYHLGDELIVDTAKGPDFGYCAKSNTQVEDDQVVKPLRPVLRLATDKDKEALRSNKAKEREAYLVCADKIAEHGLEMQLVRCESTFDGNKLTFYFTSENRVDFRSLVRDLAATLRCRIELRQIGVRDETKLIGGLGICGRPFCCNGFLETFHPVSIKMAKTQGLSLNPAKISGACGKLMCCLRYEEEAYQDAVSRLPKNDSFVETPDGAGNVVGVDFLRETVRVRLEDAPDTVQTYAGAELNVIRNGKGKRPEGYVQPPLSELEKLRKVTPRPAAPERVDLAGSIDAALSGANKERGSSNGGRNGQRQKAAGKPAQQGQQQKQQQAKPKAQDKKQTASPEGEANKDGGKSHRSRNHRRHHRGGGSKGEGAQS